MPNNQKKIDDFFKKTEINKKNQDEKVDKYYKQLKKGVDPGKETTLDKIAGFFQSIAKKVGIYYKDKPASEVKEKPSNFRRRIQIWYKRLIKRILRKFNFEAGVDILDEKSVLYRRNKVNKTILWVINIVFIIFTLIGNQNPNSSPNYVVIAVFGATMFAVNTTLKRIIHEEPRTLLKQQMAMYIGSIYILLGSIAVYIKLRVSAGNLVIGQILSNTALTDMAKESAILTYMTDLSITQAGYILIYFALVVIALYQDATLLRILFKWVFVLMFIIHVVVMHPLYQYSSITELYNYLFLTNYNVFIDILLRTIILVVFYIALYSSVSVGQMMNNKRKEELVKRREMEKDFKAVVGDVFDVISVFNSHTINQDSASVHRLAELSSRLAKILGLNNTLCEEVYNYTVIHIDRLKDLSILEYEDKDTLTEKDYKIIREKTILGSVIIKRLQLNQKSEDIVRAHFEKTTDSTFVEKMKRVQRSQEGQIILLSEIYDILRQQRNYKSSLKHKRAVELLQLEFKEYFEDYILDRFLKYQMEFEALYEKYEYTEETE
ncbi:MAG: hypothetical protein K9L74_05545 [Candidatus Izimaplasma sp.]|nr:hypothetical protein [Candidatus Izimaplasma bacterium]